VATFGPNYRGLHPLDMSFTPTSVRSAARSTRAAIRSAGLTYSPGVLAGIGVGLAALLVALVLAIGNLAQPDAQLRMAGLAAFIVGAASFAIGLHRARRQLRAFEGA